ncbi:MAG TPA: MBL fold metallo-hydrolase [Bryobacteraceae bacterium]|nr:MBL fold metallo-hydrolase [Bryobacteraceae bacterium]
MRITFWGGAQAVTGSMHAISIGNETHLLECGLLQGHRREAFQINSQLPFAASAIRSVVLSHAHLDHSGNLPTLVRNGFRGRIHATSATAELSQYMLADSAHLQEKDAAFIEKRNARRRKIGIIDPNTPVPPLYTIADAENVTSHFETCGLHEGKTIGDGLRIELSNAGHILGSAFILLEYSRNGRITKILFSGDLGRPGVPILHDPDPATEADYLILESTYGDRLHQPLGSVEDKLLRLVSKTIARGGHVIVPAFAVGRTQQLVLMLHRLLERKLLPDIPIFVDSPLAINVTDVFRRHPEEFNSEAASFVQSGLDPFGFHRLRYLREASESKALNDLRTPFVVISASGMCEGGRILHHLRNGIEDPRNLILITGFQAANTLGRRLVERHPEVKIFGEPMRLRAEVAALNELSAHADQRDLVNWVRPVAPKLKKVFLVHGEPAAQNALAAVLTQELKLDVVCPSRGEFFDLD